MKISKSLIIGSFILSSCILSFTTMNLPRPSYLIKSGNTEMLSKDEMIDSFVSSNQFSRTEMIEIIHSVLEHKYGTEYLDEAQKRYQQLSNNTDKNSFEKSLQIQGMTPQSYLDSIENSLIIQHEIYKEYHPTEKEIKTKYDNLSDKYWIEGIYLTKINRSKTEEIDQIKDKIKDGKLSFKELRDEKTYDGYSISGIGLNGSLEVNQISSDDYIDLNSDMIEKIKDTKTGDCFTGYDSSKGYYIAKKIEVKKPESYQKEKERISKQIRYQKSIDNNEQTEFVSKLFKEEHIKGNTEQIQKIIKLIKEE